MNRTCLNCGREMDDYELGCGPGGMGCMYCTRICPRCGREVFDTDLVPGDIVGCCTYCETDDL